MKILYTGFLVFIVNSCFANNYLLNGGLTSQINYQMEQEIVPSNGMKKLMMSYVVPKTFDSPSYHQKIQDFDIQFSTNPNTAERETDKRGNEIIKVAWNNPKESIRVSIKLRTWNATRLEPLVTSAPFPLQGLSSKEAIYLTATNQVPSKDFRIIREAKNLTTGAETEFDAVQRILSWIVDHVNYQLRPQSYDAMYAYDTGKGNCQNYSHLAAAMMRAVGIPVRIVNGMTLKEPYQMEMKYGILTMRMAQGRHSWIEVYFPDLGWVPFDPQQMQLFVSNRFIRVEVGLDNNETVSDGLVRWTQMKGTSGRPKFDEEIQAKFISDNSRLTAEKQSYGPRKMLFTPGVEIPFTELFFREAAAPEVVSSEQLQQLKFDTPFLFGNLDFPQDIDFLDTREMETSSENGEFELQKNFLVETSEYVTSNGQKYAQAFVLTDPIQLEKVGLALHKFGGDGQLWIELFQDDGQGKPGECLATSQIIHLNKMKYYNGYDWIDFSFDKETIKLAPGRYWVALAYTGSPIISWFFTYGKPVGPLDGTRYNTIFDEAWSHSLTYEFNYRIIGTKGK
jgi:hypothetical protein